MKEVLYELCVAICALLLIWLIIYVSGYIMCSLAGIEVLTASQSGMTAIGVTLATKLMELAQKHIIIKW